ERNPDGPAARCRQTGCGRFVSRPVRRNPESFLGWPDTYAMLLREGYGGSSPLSVTHDTQAGDVPAHITAVYSPGWKEPACRSRAHTCSYARSPHWFP